MPGLGGTLRRLGADTHDMLDVMPVRRRVMRQVRPKYSCRRCEKIVQALAPVSAVARGKATFTTLAHVVVAKFDHHLPLYRQIQMMAAQASTSTARRWPAGLGKRQRCSTPAGARPDRATVSLTADDRASGSTTPPAT